MNDARFRVGIDGGGTACRARLTDANGVTLGEGTAGPANLGLGAETALQAVMQATWNALREAGLGLEDLAATDAGLGLAGANVPRFRDSFERQAMPFRSTVVRSDAEAACLGAHGGLEGAVLILGTGSQGVLWRGGEFTLIGGWGFELSDFGSGAVLGRAALRRSLLAHEAIESSSEFTRTVMEQFGNDPAAMLAWARAARPRDWATFARSAFEHARSGDEVALQLVERNAADAARMLDRLVELGAERICLMGGTSEATRRHLPSRCVPHLADARGDAMDGALMLAGHARPSLNP